MFLPRGRKLSQPRMIPWPRLNESWIEHPILARTVPRGQTRVYKLLRIAEGFKDRSEQVHPDDELQVDRIRWYR
jgi:hypothetical protein